MFRQNYFISVIIPTYKNRGTLKRAIDSVLNQRDVLFEVIIVDDNNPGTPSRRTTEELLAKYKTDKRVKYVKHERNLNGAAARNTGIKASIGDYIAFLDDDDWFLDGKLFKQVSFLNSNPEYAAVYCQAIKNDNIISTHLKAGNLIKELLMMETFMFTPTLMFRREALLAIGGFDESFRRHQDYELMIKFFKAGFKIGAVQTPLTAIGVNLGENVLIGSEYEKTKDRFLKTFENDIISLDKEFPGLKKRIYSKHYSSIFLGYLKSHQPLQSLRIFNKYFWKAPIAFSKPILSSIVYHIKIKL